MNSRFFIGLLFFVFPLAGQACTVIDDSGQKVTVRADAQRIISLAPDLTEILFAIGAGSKIIGVMQGSNYPLPAKKIPIVAHYNRVDAETILTLRPDLIVIWSEGHLMQALRKLNIPIYVSHPAKLTDIPNTMRRLGCLAGTQKKADQSAQDFMQHYEALKKQYAQRKPISVFYQIWQQPFMTVAKSSWINDVIKLCSGRNMFENLRGAAPEVSLEDIILANPDVIMGAHSKQPWEVYWQKNWPQLQAVKNNYLFSIDPDLIERASPRILEGAEKMCESLEKVRAREKV